MENNDEKREAESLIYLATSNDEEAQSFTSALRLFGYAIQTFHDAATLAHAIAEQEPHVLLLDCDADSGKLSELVMSARLASNEAYYPVIMLSSQDNFDKRLAAVRANVDGYFLKPVDVAALSDWIDEKISRRKIRSYRILAIDDDVLLSEFYQAVLSLAAMQVVVVNDPALSMDELRRFQPDLILMDMHMPGCTGAEVAKMIRQNDTYMNIPIIFLSGDDNVDRQVSAIETGADNFLTKPIDPENLISIISNRVERYRALSKAGHI